jgi:hypothetical protein
MNKGQRIKMNQAARINGVQMKKEMEIELNMPSTGENNNHIFVKVGKRGKMLSPWTAGNMVGISQNQMKELLQKEVITLV